MAGTEAPEPTAAEIATVALATASYRGWIAYVAGGEARINRTLAAAEAAERAASATAPPTTAPPTTAPPEPVALTPDELRQLADDIAGGRL
jgi:hypothetical protein